MRIILVVFIIFLTYFPVSAQDQLKKIRITGRVIAVEDTVPVSYAHVLNITYPSGTISDQSGNFSIVCHYGDTLQFSAIGYENNNFITSQLNQTLTDHSVIIRLNHGIYMLPSVTILPFNSPEGLKRNFVNIKPPVKDKREITLEKPITRDDIGGSPAYGLSVGAIISFIHKVFSKDVKNQKRYKKVLHGENMNTFIARRFNTKVVTGIVGPTEPKMINDFIQYCHFSNDFLIFSNDYDLYFAIKQKWLSYKTDKLMK